MVKGSSVLGPAHRREGVADGLDPGEKKIEAILEAVGYPVREPRCVYPLVGTSAILASFPCRKGQRGPYKTRERISLLPARPPSPPTATRTVDEQASASPSFLLSHHPHALCCHSQGVPLFPLHSPGLPPLPDSSLCSLGSLLSYPRVGFLRTTSI